MHPEALSARFRSRLRPCGGPGAAGRSTVQRRMKREKEEPAIFEHLHPAHRRRVLLPETAAVDLQPAEERADNQYDEEAEEPRQERSARADLFSPEEKYAAK